MVNPTMQDNQLYYCIQIAGNKRVAMEFSTDIEGAPDGCCMDDEDKLWVCFFRGHTIRRIDPLTGMYTERYI